MIGDEALFDSRRGGPASGYRPSVYVGPLSALPFNRGLASPGGRAFQSNPPAFAAAALDRALERAGVSVAGRPRAGRAPGGASEVAKVASPNMARLAALTNKPSDNYFAEILLKGLGARSGGSGTTAAGARVAAGYARSRGSNVRIVDGSGLARGNRASPRAVVRLLEGVRSTPIGETFSNSLAVAGREGTLSRRMRGRGSPRQLPRQDREPRRGEHAVRLLPHARRADALVLLPHERRLAGRRPTPSGPDGRGPGPLGLEAHRLASRRSAGRAG